MDPFNFGQAAMDEVNVLLGCGDPSLRFLLESM
jgi:hypothetical protein